MLGKYENEMEDYKSKQSQFFSEPNRGNAVFDVPEPRKPKVERLKENLPDRAAAEKAKEEFEKAAPKK